MRKIVCPNCKKEATWEGNPYRPFCSEKCKLADLSKWLNEEYRVESCGVQSGKEENRE
ncbi:MAG: DNA gyrase inhibitor YacG [Desulfurobacteriaceae bacterium]